VTPTLTKNHLIRGIGLLAATSIVVGGVIGTGVFLKARVMTCNVGAPRMVIIVWIVAGLFSLAGALTYAELAAMMPRAGGEYLFIREAYGPLWGFLYGWMRFFVATSGGQAALAAGFAIFFNVVTGGMLGTNYFTLDLAGYQAGFGGVQALAITAIFVITLVNCAAVSTGGNIASAFTVLKVVLVTGVGVGAFLLARGDWGHFALSRASGACEGVEPWARGGISGFGAAMIGALWAYNGWNELTYVAGEVSHPQRNLPLALIGGIGVLGVLYVFVNSSYLYVLTPDEVAGVPTSSSVATEVLGRFVGPVAGRLMAGAMAMSTFGALLVAILLGARIPYAMARDGLFFRYLAHVSPRTCVPIRALLAQALWASFLVLSGSFDTLTDYSMFAILIFVALAASSVFVLRRKMPGAERPYRTWGYPVVPMLFLVVSGLLIGNTLLTVPRQALAGLGLLALGLPFYWYWSRQHKEWFQREQADTEAWSIERTK
jgi:basic amino acid/polyamine antiporter, APA family